MANNNGGDNRFENYPGMPTGDGLRNEPNNPVTIDRKWLIGGGVAIVGLATIITFNVFSPKPVVEASPTTSETPSASATPSFTPEDTPTAPPTTQTPTTPKQTPTTLPTSSETSKTGLTFRYSGKNQSAGNFIITLSNAKTGDSTANVSLLCKGEVPYSGMVTTNKANETKKYPVYGFPETPTLINPCDENGQIKDSAKTKPARYGSFFALVAGVNGAYEWAKIFLEQR